MTQDNAQLRPKRRPRHKRVAPTERPSMALTERDVAIIRAVNDHRALLGSHIQRLFAMSRSTAQDRLARLFHHEYLERHFVPATVGGPASSPAIYTLGKRGAYILIDTLGYDRSQLRVPKQKMLSWLFVEHLLKINDFRVAVTVAAQHNGWQLVTWDDETVFRAHPDYVTLTDATGKQRKKPVLPDGYFCLATPNGRTRFFLEIDRGTEPHSKFRPQVMVYEAYTMSGQYRERYQASSLRILVVTTSERRLANLKAVTKRAEGDRKYWFTTFGAVSPETVLTAPIWYTLEGKERLPLIADEVP